jgi:aspartyl protease/PDZ domain-containing protein
MCKSTGVIVSISFSLLLTAVTIPCYAQLKVDSTLFDRYVGDYRAQAPVIIPVDVTSYGLIFLRARVNDSQPLWFALDSGASFPFVIDLRQAKALGLEQRDVFTASGGAGPDAYQVGTSNVVSLKVGDLVFANQTVAVIALSSLESLAGRPLDGLVGFDLFTRYVVELDYFAGRIVLHDPRTYRYSGPGEIIRLTKQDNHFLVAAKIQMPGRAQVNGRFLVDTGGAFAPVVLSAPFARANDLPASNQRTIADHSLSGLGGETKVLVSRGTSFTLGKLVIDEPLVYVSQDTAGALASRDFDGIIGGELLRKFKVIFDYPRHRLIFEKNSNSARPVEYDMSGIRLRAGGNDLRTFRVSQVLENSPAAEGGLREGDVLTAIAGAPASKFTLDEIYQMLKRPGRQYKLNFRRDGETFFVRITTRRLI